MGMWRLIWSCRLSAGARVGTLSWALVAVCVVCLSAYATRRGYALVITPAMISPREHNTTVAQRLERPGAVHALGEPVVALESAPWAIKRTPSQMQAKNTAPLRAPTWPSQWDVPPLPPGGLGATSDQALGDTGSSWHTVNRHHRPIDRPIAYENSLGAADVSVARDRHSSVLHRDDRSAS